MHFATDKKVCIVWFILCDILEKVKLRDGKHQWLSGAGVGGVIGYKWGCTREILGRWNCSLWYNGWEIYDYAFFRYHRTVYQKEWILLYVNFKSKTGCQKKVGWNADCDKWI